MVADDTPPSALTAGDRPEGAGPIAAGPVDARPGPGTASRAPLWALLTASAPAAHFLLGAVSPFDDGLRALLAGFALALLGWAWSRGGTLRGAAGLGAVAAAVVLVQGSRIAPIPRLSDESLAAASDALLVVLLATDQASGSGDVAGAPGSARHGDAVEGADAWLLAPAPEQGAALLTALSGLEPIEHRRLGAGDRCTADALTLGEALAQAGFESRTFLDVQDALQSVGRRAARGTELLEAGGSLKQASRWMLEEHAAPRVAQVIVAVPGDLGAAMADAVEALSDAAAAGAVTTIIGIPGFADAGQGDDGWLSLAQLRCPSWSSSGAKVEGHANPIRALSSAMPDLLRRVLRDGDGILADCLGRLGRAGIAAARGRGAPAGPDGRRLNPPSAVAIAFDRGGGPHRALALFPGGELQVELTPLGGHPTDDWQLIGPSASHVAYGNRVRFRHSEGRPGQDDGGLDGASALRALARWRSDHWGRSWRPSAGPGADASSDW